MAGIHRETAKIYQFPLMPKRRADSGPPGPAAPPTSALKIVDTCWYHDEAIKDEAAKPDSPKHS